MEKPTSSETTSSVVLRATVAKRAKGEPYTDEQFTADLKKASEPLEAMAERARQSIKNGTGIKFPA